MIYEALERWHTLSFLKTPQTLELLRQLHFQALEPEKLCALLHVVAEDLGYHIYRAVEHTKCELSESDLSAFALREPPVEITDRLSRSDFEKWIAAELITLEQCGDRLLARCNVRPGDVDSVFLTGGSSFVPAVRQIFTRKFGLACLRSGEELTTVATGLALRALSR